MFSEYRVKRLPSGEADVDQGVVHGFPMTFNPDDRKFYIHAPDSDPGTGVLGRFADFRNAVQFARRKAGHPPQKEATP